MASVYGRACREQGDRVKTPNGDTRYAGPHTSGRNHNNGTNGRRSWTRRSSDTEDSVACEKAAPENAIASEIPLMAKEASAEFRASPVLPCAAARQARCQTCISARL